MEVFIIIFVVVVIVGVGGSIDRRIDELESRIRELEDKTDGNDFDPPYV